MATLPLYALRCRAMQWQNPSFCCFAVNGLLKRPENVAILKTQKFRKGVGGQMGVVAKKSFLSQRLRPLFCALFAMAPLGKRNPFLENFFGCFGGLLVANPFPPTHFETSEKHGNAAMFIPPTPPKGFFRDFLCDFLVIFLRQSLRYE